jgi:hypothetical protein
MMFTGYYGHQEKDTKESGRSDSCRSSRTTYCETIGPYIIDKFNGPSTVLNRPSHEH